MDGFLFALTREPVCDAESYETHADAYKFLFALTREPVCDKGSTAQSVKAQVSIRSYARTGL